MAKRNVTKQPSTQQPRTIKAPQVSTSVGVAVRDLASTEGTGVVGGFARGWQIYDDPMYAARRQATHERLKSEALAYFLDKLDKS